MRGREHLVDAINRKSPGIKVVANPVLQFLVLVVVGVTDSILELVESPDAPTILRRAGELALGAHWIVHVGIGRQALLKDNAVLPAVAEIIGVGGLGTDPAEYAGEMHGALVFHRGYSHESVFRVGPPEVPAANAEFVHMAFLPPHRSLQHLVQLCQSHVRGHQQSTPDRWAGAEQSDLELIDFLWNRALFRWHS